MTLQPLSIPSTHLQGRPDGCAVPPLLRQPARQLPASAQGPPASVVLVLFHLSSPFYSFLLTRFAYFPSLKEFEHQVRARAQVQHMTPRRKPRAKRAFDEDDEDELEPRQNLWRPAADPGWMGMADAAANNGGSAGMDEAL